MANAGTEIYAAADGIVSYASGYSIWPYGKQVDIQHGDGMVTRYTHCWDSAVATIAAAIESYIENYCK